MSAKVLIVEDEAPLAEMLRYNLEAEGFRVAHAETGEALAGGVADAHGGASNQSDAPGTQNGMSHAEPLSCRASI